MAGVIYDQVGSLELSEMDRGKREKKKTDVYESGDVVHVQETEDTSTVQALPAFRRRGSRCSRLDVAAVCLGLLCVLLLIPIIWWLRHNHHVQLKDNLSKERDQLKISNQNLTEERDQLKISNQNLTEERDQLKISNQNLTEERDQLKISNQNLTKERDQLKMKNSCWKLTEDSTPGDLDQSPGCVKRCMKSRSCYFLVYGWKTWSEGQQDCRARGADLVIINSKEEQKFLRDVFGSTEFWIGLSDAEREGIWKWVDGSELTGNGYWMPGKPNNQNEEDCAVFKTSEELQTWNDIQCSYKRSWVCELKPVG